MRTDTRKGFTILELIVAAAISTVLLMLAISLSTDVLDFWGHSQSKLSSHAQARVILETLSTDLESAVFDNEGTWMAADILTNRSNSGKWQDASSSLQKPQDSLEIDFDDENIRPVDYRFGAAGTWLRFFSQPMDGASSSDPGKLCAVAYQIIRRSPIDGSAPSYNLYRSVVSATNTLDEAIEDGGYHIDLFDGSSSQRNPGEVTTPNRTASLMGLNVVDFGILLYTQAPQGGLKRIFPNQGQALSYRQNEETTPVAADIYLRILTEEGRQRIDAYEDGRIASDDPEFWWNTVTQFSETFSRRVYFRSQAL